MTIDYGTIAEVVAFTRHLLDGGSSFSTSTRPTDTEVSKFLERASAVMNGALATFGFTTPITDAQVKPALDDWVIQRAAEYVELTQRGVGYGEGEGSRTAAFNNLAKSAYDYVKMYALGWQRLGASQGYGGKSAGLAFTGLDAQSQRVDPDDSTLEQPLFTRRQFDDTSATRFDVEDYEDDD